MRLHTAVLRPLLAAGLIVVSAGAASLVAGPVAASEQSAARPATVVIKFEEGSGLRVRSGALAATGGVSTAAASGLAASLAAVGADLTRATRLYGRTEAEIDRERAEAQAESGDSLPDLNLYYVLPVPTGTTAEAFAARLAALKGIDYAEPSPQPAPPPVDIAPTTPSFVRNQGYRGAPPAGVGSLSPATVRGSGGTDVRVADVEYSWQFNHEDLELTSAANLDTGATLKDPFNDNNHGTAVLGEIYGRRNAYGVTGLAPSVTMRVAPANTVQFGYNPGRAISVATGKLRRGDVIIIEQQYPVCGLTSYGPLEWLQPVFDAVKVATAKGIVVVAAAGNGNVNLDRASCQGKFNRSVRNSGAIIVGAGSAGTRFKMGFSSYGSRVDVQGWGEKVMTTGYGDAFAPSQRQLYTAVFSGTSSATPIVTGVVASLQGALKAKGLKPATASEMRRALVATGSPQQRASDGRVGPLPNAAKALAYLLKLRGQSAPAAF